MQARVLDSKIAASLIDNCGDRPEREKNFFPFTSDKRLFRHLPKDGHIYNRDATARNTTNF